MATKPWDKWIPGVLNKKQMISLRERGYIKYTPKDDNAYGQSSMDLHLSDEVYEMQKGCIKPSIGHYEDYLNDPTFAKKIISDEKIYKFEKKVTYVVKIKEEFDHLGELADAEFYGLATAKSTVGRMDVLARLIFDGMDEYESFCPERLNNDNSNGKMYLEITPMTFKLLIKDDISLSQLRIFYGNPEDAEIKSKLLNRTVLHGGQRKDGTLSVDLDSVKIGGENAVAMQAKDDVNDYFELWSKDKYDYTKYWETVPYSSTSPDKRLVIKKEKFYILRSKEKISLPRSIAVYCKAMDEALGEMRIHYAGFVHPNFGFDRDDKEIGTPLIFEVRGHDIDISLSDNEKLAKLTFYRMSEDAENDKNVKTENDAINNNAYDKQTLKLSKIFKEFK